MFAQCRHVRQRIVFPENVCFRFSRSLKSIKRAMRKVQTIVFFSKYHQNDFLYGAKIPRREALAGDNLALPLIFIL